MSALSNVQKFYPGVTSVKDATQDTIVNVSTSDTRSKAVRNHKECALAIACKRNNLADACIISIKVSYLIKGNTAYRYITPESVAREITSFDRDAKFEPGEYYLSRPCKSAKLGSHRPTGPKINKSNMPKRNKLHFTESIRESLKTIK